MGKIFYKDGAMRWIIYGWLIRMIVVKMKMLSKYFIILHLGVKKRSMKIFEILRNSLILLSVNKLKVKKEMKTNFVLYNLFYQNNPFNIRHIIY